MDQTQSNSISNDEVKDLKQRLAALESDNKLILTNITEVKMGLCGSEKIGLEGMVQKVNRHDEYIEKDKKQKYKLVGGAIVILFILSALKDYFIGMFKS